MSIDRTIEHEIVVPGTPEQVWNAIVGLYSPTDSSKGITLRTTFIDRMNDILFGRQPVSIYDDLVKEWRTNGGDTIRGEYEKAFQEAKA
jgi:putative aldouronate transport system substrate-binding protein